LRADNEAALAGLAGIARRVKQAEVRRLKCSELRTPTFSLRTSAFKSRLSRGPRDVSKIRHEWCRSPEPCADDGLAFILAACPTLTLSYS